MCNYCTLWKSFLITSTFFNFWNVYSGEFPKFYIGNISRNFLKNLSRWEMKTGNVHKNYMLNHRMKGLFFHSFCFLVFWLQVFKICMVLSEHPMHHISCAWKKKTKEKKPFKCYWWPEQNSCGPKSSLLKKSSL